MRFSLSRLGAVLAAVTIAGGVPSSARGAALSTPSGTVLWQGDFKSGSLAQWDDSQRVAADRIAVVTSTGSASGFAGRFEVRQGDNPLPPVFGHRATGDRAELVRRVIEREGDERWYDWRTLFPVGFPKVVRSVEDPYAFQLFVQWHQEGLTGSPPVYFQALGDTIGLATARLGSIGQFHGGPLLWSAPMARGTWHHFRLHVKWSVSPARGLLELWHDGVLALAPTHVATLEPGQGAYLKVGLYRSALISQTGVVFHDGFRVLAP